MNKFKIGDYVWIKDDLENGKEYGDLSFYPDMGEFKGKQRKIIKVDNKYYQLNDCKNWWFSEEMLEEFNENKEKDTETMNKKIICPAIYKHFKNKYYATMGISKPINDKTFWELTQQKKHIALCTIHTEKPTEHIPMIRLEDGTYYHYSSSEQEVLVVYKSLYDNSNIYIRPLKMFLSEVDHNKYPNVKQKFRFEIMRY